MNAMLETFLLLLILIFLILIAVTQVVHMIQGVPWVPSGRTTVKTMIQLAKLKRGEVVYDLGCGDARFLIQAEKLHGIRGIGYENAPIPYLFGMVRKWLNRSKIDLRYENFFKTSLKNANVIFLYLGPDINRRLSSKIKKECKKGTRIVSHAFHLPGFTPIKTVSKEKAKSLNTLYLYVR